MTPIMKNTYTVILDDVKNNRDAWLELKKGRVGGSQIAAIMGVGWQTPLDLWCEFTGRKPPEPENKFMRRGRRLEPYIEEIFNDRFRGELLCRPIDELWEFKADPRFIATPDRRVYEIHPSGNYPVGLLEMKTSIVKGHWSPVSAPDSAIVQGQWQAGIGGFGKLWVCGLTGLDEDRMYSPTFDFSYTIFDACRYEADAFLKAVETDTPPLARTGDESLVNTIIAAPPEGEVDLPDDLSPIFEEHLRAKAMKTAMEAQIKAVDDVISSTKAQLWQRLNGARVGRVRSFCVEIVERRRKAYSVGAKEWKEIKIYDESEK